MAGTHWTRRAAITLGAAIALALLSAAPAAAAFVREGFQDVPFITGLDAPTAVRFAPGVDGRIFVAEKRGVVLAFDGPLDTTPTTVIDLRTEVYDFLDRGLLGMALDPGFGPEGGSIYLLYARDAPIGGTPPRWNDDCRDLEGNGCLGSGRLVRVPVGPFGVATGSPVTVVENEWCAQFPSHTIGTVAFGPDGMLYAGAGESANYNTPDWGQFGNPCGDPVNEGGALRSQDVRTDADPAGLDGAIVRVDPLTGAAAPGNPFGTSPDLGKRRVIAYGLRNPFRFTFRPGTRELWLGDVGWNVWEEIDRIDTADPVAENLGWPCFEAGDRADAFAWLDLCSSLAAGAVTMPVFAYRHGQDVAGCGAGNPGSAISGIAFHGAGGYPTAYDGALFFADYARDCIWAMRTGPGGLPDPTTLELISQGMSGGGPIDLQAGPDGDLYYATFGAIRRLRPATRPTALVTADPAYGASPLQVAFDATGSTGDGLTYEWDLDGSWEPGGATATHEFTGRGNHVVRVRVTDAHGATDIAAVTIAAGDGPPRDVTIEPVGPVQAWAVGDTLRFHGSAVDDEPVMLTWTLVLMHCVTGGSCHEHPMQTVTGPDATFTAPDHAYPSHLELRLRATDDLGLEGAAAMRLDPRTVHLTVRADPAPLVVRLGAEPARTETTVPLIAGSRVTLTTQSPQQGYRFVRWSDGDVHRIRTVAIRGDTALVARFERPTAPAPPAAGATPAPPDTTAPRLRLAPAHRLDGRRLRLRAGCPDERCVMRVHAVVHIRGRRTGRTRDVVRTLPGGGTVLIRLALPSTAVRALRRGTLVRVQVRATATDGTGNRTRRSRTVALRR